MSELYSQLCKKSALYNAWLKIKEKDSTGGIDDISIDSFEQNLTQNLDQLLQELIQYKYIPEPYKELKFPKKEKNEYRYLSLPVIRDKIVQQAVKVLIEPLLEEQFLNVSYAYRQHKGTVKAIRRVNHYIQNEKRTWVTQGDIDRYFDTINHQVLLSILSHNIKDEKIETLISLWIKMGKIDYKKHWKSSTMGIPQGNILSPLLSNLYLHAFDQFMTEKNFGYIRYADDFLILSRTEGEAYHAYKESKWFLEKKFTGI